MSGKKANAPKMPIISLKKGTIMETNVVKITKQVLHTRRKRVRFNDPRPGNLTVYSLCMKLFLVHVVEHHSSTNAYKGWVNTCINIE